MAKALQLVGDRLVTIGRHSVCALNSSKLSTRECCAFGSSTVSCAITKGMLIRDDHSQRVTLTFVILLRLL
jgi:hypothetical protein